MNSIHPAQRIGQIMSQNNPDISESGEYHLVEKVDAIIQYLSEEWEKNQPCKHKHIEKETGVCIDCKLVILR